MVVAVVNAHTKLKKCVTSVMFGSALLLGKISKDVRGIESIYEGFHPPETMKLNYPFLTYRINWYPDVPTFFLTGTFVIDVWDLVAGNNSERVEDICTVLARLLDDTTIVDGWAVVRCKLQSDEWVQEEDASRIHRQLVFRMRTIDVSRVV